MSVPFRPRGEYTGYRAFGSGDGAVLIAPSVVHDLRSAAELATAERRIAGGLLYGRGWADDLGTYLVIDHYLEAGPGENSGDRISADGDDDDFTLSEADLRLLREDAARMYSAALEAGWWRTRAALGEFGPNDFETQGELVGPDGVGLLVYGSGIYWGTAYLGPVGLAPDSAGTLSAVPDPVPVPPGPGPAPTREAGITPEPERGRHRGGREPAARACPARHRAAAAAGQAAQDGLRPRDSPRQAGRQARGRGMARNPGRSCLPTFSS